MGVSKWLAPLMQQYDVIWCPIHLMPYKEQWPVGAPSASVYLVEAAAEQTGLPDGYPLMTALVEVAPLCCYVHRPVLAGIHSKTVPR